MNTFWLDLSQRTTSGGSSSDPSGAVTEVVSPATAQPDLPTVTQRLVGWNVEVLKRALKKIVAKRAIVGPPREEVPRYVELEFTDENPEALHKAVEVMEFAAFEQEGILSAEQLSATCLGKEVEDQLYEYVVAIAERYRDNHFHSFSHCSHVMVRTRETPVVCESQRSCLS